MVLSEESNGNFTNINLSTGEYSPFDIKLNLKKKNKNKNENSLDSKYDYRGNNENEEKKYGNTTENTTEYSENIIKSSTKPLANQFEYIGQLINGEMANISSEKLQLIREQMNGNSDLKPYSSIKDNSSNFRSNSASRGNMIYYSSKASSNSNEMINMSINQTTNALNPNNHTNNQLGAIINNNIYNSTNYKTIPDYSTMTVQKRPFIVPHLNYGAKLPNPTLNNKNDTNTPRLNENTFIEQRPRMINHINSNRSSSTPHNQNINRFYKNKSPNMFQPNPTNNPFQTNQFYEQNKITNINIKHPYDRNTERTILSSKYSFNQESRDKPYNNITINNPSINNQKFNQGKLKAMQIKQTQLYTTQTIPYQKQSSNLPSNKINQSKMQMFLQPQNTQFQSKSYTPLPSQPPSLEAGQNEFYKQISQQQIALAQMASMQNQENPNLKNLQAVTLSQSHELEEENPQQNNYEDNNNNMKEEQEQVREEEINIEALFITEEGRVIFRNGLLRGIIHKYAEIDDVVSKIQDILLKGAKFHLVYKAFDLDDNAKTFHEKCDDLDMSLVLIETKKDVRFGGFTTKSWKGNCLKKKDNNAFVFNLETNKIFDVIPNEPAVGCYPKFGPVFFGCQIRIYDEFFSRGGSTCHRGLNYKTKKDFELNNGEQKYLVKDIEVYRIETIDID